MASAYSYTATPATAVPQYSVRVLRWIAIQSLVLP